MKFEKILKQVKKKLAPTPEFVRRAHERYLAVYDAEYPKQHATYWKAYLMRATSIAAALVVILGGASVYADQINVSAQSPLYPFKRVSESIRLAVSSAEHKQAVQTEVAVRRVQEVSDSRDKGASATSRHELAMDANIELKKSLQSLKSNQSVSLFMAAGSLAEASPSPSVSPTSTPQTGSPQAPLLGAEAILDAEVDMETKIEDQRDNESDSCKAVQKAKKNADVWSQIGDTELDRLFNEKCQ